MSPRAGFLILFALSSFVLASGRGGGRGGGHGGGHFGGGHSGHSHYGGHSTGSHAYPNHNGLSGNSHQSHSYPHSNGMSGNSGGHSTQQVHHHYYPPTQVHYGSSYHPVYQGTPPVYVYTYRDSGSRYNDLLTGLALYNLGRMSSHHDSHYYSHAQTYKGPTGEHCELQIIKTNGEYEKTKIDCQLMSSFIVDAEYERERERNRVVSTNTNSVTTVTKVENSGDNSSAVFSTTVQNTTTVVDALETKGPPIQVTSGMDCYMVRIYRDSNIRKKIDCGLLQTYSRSSFRNDSSRNVPFMNIVILLFSVAYLVM